MNQLFSWEIIVVGFLFSRIIEIRHHKKMYKFLKSKPHEEFMPIIMKLYYSASILVIPIIYFEYITLNHNLNLVVQSIGMFLAMVGLLVRIWAIQSLGWLWTMRCIFTRGAKETIKGPYRFVKHPEYYARLIEGIGLCMALNAYYSSFLYLLVMIGFLAKIIPIEGKISREYFLFSKNIET